MPAPGSFLGSTLGEAAAFAAGIALGPILEPLVQALKNESWSQYPDAPLEAILMAQAVLEGKIDPDTGAAEAALTGISPARFTSLQKVLGNAPSISAAMTLIRRGQLAQAEFATILTRAGLEPEWITAYQAASSTGLQPWEEPLSPADLALGLIRGNLNGFDVDGEPAFPPGGPTDGSTVPPDPLSTIDVVAEAAASGLTAERMAVLARNVGLPPGIMEGLEMWRRGFINEAAMNLLIEQSDLRLSWTDAIKQMKAKALLPHDYIEDRLRGWTPDVQTMYDGGALNGYSTDQMDLLYRIQGRPLSAHQVFIGLQRGGTYDGPTDDIDPAFLKALQESNIRPEWYNLMWAQRYTLPGYFVLKNLVPNPISVADATTLLEQEGWPPYLAAATAQSWGGTTTTSTSPRVKSAQTKAVNAIQKRYLAGGLSSDQATSDLTAAGISASDATAIIAQWDIAAQAAGDQLDTSNEPGT
jgi:hypothetical protein